MLHYHNLHVSLVFGVISRGFSTLVLFIGCCTTVNCVCVGHLFQLYGEAFDQIEWITSHVGMGWWFCGKLSMCTMLFCLRSCRKFWAVGRSHEVVDHLDNLKPIDYNIIIGKVECTYNETEIALQSLDFVGSLNGCILEEFRCPFKVD